MVQSNSRPVVSVIIPAYNARLYIGATLESAVNQTFRSFEIIVVDDGSTDDTQSIAQNFCDRGVTVISQSNAGAAAARNRALSIARGEYVALLDSDDLWEPDYLQTMVGFLISHPEISIAFSDSVFFGQSMYSGRRFQEVYPPCAPITFAKVAAQVSHVCVAATIRREVFDRIGLFDARLRAVDDFDLWLRALHAGCRIEPVQRVLVRYRRHVSALSFEGTLNYSSGLQILAKWRDRNDLGQEERQAVEKSWQEFLYHFNLGEALGHIRKRNFALARQQLRQAEERVPKWRFRAARLGLALAPGATRLAVLAWRR
jgi:glycosyltransferase involved in cell wall biosynthesis